MMSNTINYAKRCHTRQIHSNFKHQLMGVLASTKATWLFEMWGMDVIGPLNMSLSRRHCFILAITNYFSKWAEVIPLTEVKATDVVKFVQHDVIYRFGVPWRILHDNGTQ